MKKLIYVFAILVASVSFVSCGGSEEEFVVECPVENWEGTYSGDCAGNPIELSINAIGSVTVSFDNVTDTTPLEFSQDGCAATFNSAIFGEFSLVLDERTLTVEVSNSTSGQFDDCGNFITLEKPLPSVDENIVGIWTVDGVTGIVEFKGSVDNREFIDSNNILTLPNIPNNNPSYIITGSGGVGDSLVLFPQGLGGTSIGYGVEDYDLNIFTLKNLGTDQIVILKRKQ